MAAGCVDRNVFTNLMAEFFKDSIVEEVGEVGGGLEDVSLQHLMLAGDVMQFEQAPNNRNMKQDVEEGWNFCSICIVQICFRKKDKIHERTDLFFADFHPVNLPVAAYHYSVNVPGWGLRCFSDLKKKQPLQSITKLCVSAYWIYTEMLRVLRNVLGKEDQSDRGTFWARTGQGITTLTASWKE